MTDGRTDGRTFAIVESLSRLKICDFFSVLQLSNPLLLGLNALICGTLLIPAVPMMYIYNWMLRYYKTDYVN